MNKKKLSYIWNLYLCGCGAFTYALGSYSVIDIFNKYVLEGLFYQWVVYVYGIIVAITAPAMFYELLFKKTTTIKQPLYDLKVPESKYD